MPSRRVMVKVGKRKWELTPKQRDIVGVLRKSRQWIGPTAIGETCGRSYDASAWCSVALKELLELGVVERSLETPNKGKYRLAKA
jgi:DNA-binding HxlR family transcriptional regulator